MAESKRINRMAPCSQYDFAATQAWIEDMAAQGWQLDADSFFMGLFSFVRSEPKSIRCRLEATTTPGGMFSEKREPDGDTQAMYREMGWQWKGRRGQFQIYITEDPDAPELHTDPRIQALSIKALTKFYRGALANTIITFILDFFLIFDCRIGLFTAALGFWPTAAVLALLLAVPIGQLLNVVRFYRLRRQLELGDVPPQRKDYRKRRWFYYLKPPVLAVLWIALLGSALARVDNSTDLEDWNEPLPFASLQEIFPGADVDSSDDWLGSDSINTFGDWFTPLTMEYGESADITLPDGTIIWADMNVLYHQTRYDWFAMLLSREHTLNAAGGVIEHFFTDDIQVIQLEGLDADYAVCWQNVYHYVLLCRGNQVIRVSYNHKIAEFYTPTEFAQLILDSISKEG